jgi:hypothetical protein
MSVSGRFQAAVSRANALKFNPKIANRHRQSLRQLFDLLRRKKTALKAVFALTHLISVRPQSERAFVGDMPRNQRRQSRRSSWPTWRVQVRLRLARHQR